MLQDIEITIKICSGNAARREVLLANGYIISEEDNVNWVVRDPRGSVLEYGCDVVELIEQYGRELGSRVPQPSINQTDISIG